jgi:8-oxo-dGTP pyrophosphatase MutT (NUDIX family)
VATADDRRERQVLVVLGWVWRGAEVVLVRRHAPGLPALHERWELPGGKVAFGEHPAAAVAREVLEETGYAVTVRALLPYLYSTIWEYPDRRDHAILLVYDCLAGEQLTTPADPRVTAVAWVRPAAIDFTTALPSVRHFVSWWQAQGGS